MLATLIRLYEFLKNSLLIELCQSTTKRPFRLYRLKAALVLNFSGGGDRTRTRYLLLAKQPLYQVSYTPLNYDKRRIALLQNSCVHKYTANFAPSTACFSKLTHYPTDKPHIALLQNPCVPTYTANFAPSTACFSKLTKLSFAREKWCQARRGWMPHTPVCKSSRNAAWRRLSLANGGSGWARTNDPRLIKTVL